VRLTERRPQGVPCKESRERAAAWCCHRRYVPLIALDGTSECQTRGPGARLVYARAILTLHRERR
jgi:hypothetical protein